MKRFLEILFALCLALTLLSATSFAAESYPDSINVGGVILADGKYYVPNGSGSIAEASTVPASGYIRYNKTGGVLTLNNFSLTTNGTTRGIIISLNIGEYRSLNLSLTGTNYIGASGNIGLVRGFDMPNVMLTISGSGSLEVASAASDAIYVRSLTVNDDITLNAHTSGTNQVKAIVSDLDVSFSKGNITATGLTGGETGVVHGISSVYGSVKISGTAKVTAKASGYGFAIDCSREPFVMSGGELNASIVSGDGTAISANGGCDISGGKLTINSTYGGGIMTFGNSSATNDDIKKGNVKISGSAEVSINTPGSNIYTDQGAVTISGGTVDLTTSNGNCVYTPNGKIIFSGGNTTAKNPYITTFFAVGGFEVSGGTVDVSSQGDAPVYTEGDLIVSGGRLTAVTTETLGYPALYANGGNVTISGGNVTAIANAASGIHTTGNLTVSGGTLAAATNATATHYSVRAIKSFTVNGNCVVYLNNYKSATQAISKGVLYEGTVVSLDSNRNTVLSGGVGTVYDNPKVTIFEKPTSSVLGTVLDSYVTATNTDSPVYNGSAQTYDPKLKVQKFVLTRNLIKDTDYTVTPKGDAIHAGTKQLTASAIGGSGNIGSKDFDYTILPKTLRYSTTNLNVSKTVDGTTDAAPVLGALKLSGIINGDDVSLSYDQLSVTDFPSAASGTYPLLLTVVNPSLSGANAADYALPDVASFMIDARIIDPNAAIVPATGDSSRVALWLGLLIVGLVGIGVCGCRKRRFER